MLLAAVGGWVLLGRLPRAWNLRREAQLLVLSAPALSLGAGLGALHHFAGEVCFIGLPPWDYVLGLTLPLGMAGIALGALVLGLVRLALIGRVLGRGVPAPAELHGIVDQPA